MRFDRLAGQDGHAHQRFRWATTKEDVERSLAAMLKAAAAANAVIA